MKIIETIAKFHRAKYQEIDFEYNGKIKLGYSVYSGTNKTGKLPVVFVDNKKCYELFVVEPSFTSKGVAWNIFNNLTGKKVTDVKTSFLKLHLGVTMPSLTSIKPRLRGIDPKKFGISLEKGNKVILISYCHETLNINLVQTLFPYFNVSDVSLSHRNSKYYLIESA